MRPSVGRGWRFGNHRTDELIKFEGERVAKRSERKVRKFYTDVIPQGRLDSSKSSAPSVWPYEKWAWSKKKKTYL